MNTPTIVIGAYDNDIRLIKILNYKVKHAPYAKHKHALSLGCPDIHVAARSLFKVKAPDLFCNTTNYFQNATRKLPKKTSIIQRDDAKLDQY